MCVEASPMTGKKPRLFLFSHHRRTKGQCCRMIQFPFLLFPVNRIKEQERFVGESMECTRRAICTRQNAGAKGKKHLCIRYYSNGKRISAKGAFLRSHIPVYARTRRAVIIEIYDNYSTQFVSSLANIQQIKTDVCAERPPYHLLP